ncbi:DNA primase small subunit domain-containing protein [Vulcanisaeta souniana]|uniref:DNA primase small subunit domain-containing protein n=1 Tax=Vulcanisaeta souniana TaxID=164452 RepID=UPI0006D1BA4A|nr:DNA primase small subunit domain-containing protein [Vulcanisaeta souniana]
MPGFIELVRVLFRNYYRGIDLSEVSDLERREFGFQFLDKEGMIRHIGFRGGSDELRRYIINNVPSHIYYSAALYGNPTNQDMDAKDWLGADLVFDIDGDHLPTPNCQGVELMTLECLGDAAEEVGKLLDFLIEDFGFSDSSIKIFFSGHRGYHVHIELPDVRGLTDEERREIVDYLLLRGFDIEHLIRGNASLIDARLRGIGGRLASVIHEVDPELLNELSGRKRVGKYLVRKLSSLNAMISERLSVHIDEVVTMDIHRLIRMPNSLHGKTGLKVIRISPSELERGVEFIIDKAVQFRKGSLTIRLARKVPVRRVLGEEINGDEGSIIKVPTYIGLYLVINGWGELVD